MALSNTELELQSTEYLPAREVLTSFGGHGGHHAVDGPEGGQFAGGILNGFNVQDVVSDNNVENVQVGLVNVLVDDVQGAIDLGTFNQDSISHFG